MSKGSKKAVVVLLARCAEDELLDVTCLSATFRFSTPHLCAEGELRGGSPVLGGDLFGAILDPNVLHACALYNLIATTSPRKMFQGGANWENVSSGTSKSWTRPTVTAIVRHETPTTATSNRVNYNFHAPHVCDRHGDIVVMRSGGTELVERQ
jgi:hypothetical protein